jgi:hypothetical protein
VVASHSHASSDTDTDSWAAPVRPVVAPKVREGHEAVPCHHTS